MSTPAERVAQAGCQRLFAASQGLVLFSGLATIAAVLLLWLWAGWIAPRLSIGAGLLVGVLGTGIAAQYYGFRIRLDADLFGMLGETGPVSEADFAAGIDAFRDQLIGRQEPGGPLRTRYTGALRLWRHLALALGLQGMLLAGAAGAAWWAALAGA